MALLCLWGLCRLAELNPEALVWPSFWSAKLYTALIWPQELGRHFLRNGIDGMAGDGGQGGGAAEKVILYTTRMLNVLLTKNVLVIMDLLYKDFCSGGEMFDPIARVCNEACPSQARLRYREIIITARHLRNKEGDIVAADEIEAALKPLNVQCIQNVLPLVNQNLVFSVPIALALTEQVA